MHLQRGVEHLALTSENKMKLLSLDRIEFLSQIFTGKVISSLILIFCCYGWENNDRGLIQDQMRTCT